MSKLKTVIIKTPPVLRVVSLYFLIASLLSVAAYAIQPHAPAAAVNVQPLAQVQKPRDDTNEITGVPARLVIARLGIDLAIVTGNYDRAQDEWTLTDDAAQFAAMTALPSNRQGNTMLYGHNTAAVLEPVKDLVPGDVLTLTTTNGHIFTYTYVRDMSVTPDRTDVVTPVSSTPQVTLLTCEGWFSATRRVMYFQFDHVL